MPLRQFLQNCTQKKMVTNQYQNAKQQTLKKKLKAEGTQSTRKQWNKKEKG